MEFLLGQILEELKELRKDIYNTLGVNMSASVCGAPLTQEMLEKAAQKALELHRPDPMLISLKAYRMLQKIYNKHPDFFPTCETDIWIKAYKMGLTEDE